jgi:plastocyanin
MSSTSGTEPRAGAGPVAILGLVVLALVAACSNTEASVNRRPQGGSGTPSIVNGIQQTTIKAGDTYRFDPATITVHPGRVTVLLVNDGKGAPHNWTLQGLPGVATPLAASGQTRSVTFTAPAPGTYRFVCTIHVKQGQTGKLVVRPG